MALLLATALLQEAARPEPCCKAGTWMKHEWTKKHDGGEEKYTVTQTVIRFEGAMAWRRIENSLGQTMESAFELSLQLRLDAVHRLPTTCVAEKELRQDELEVDGRKLPCVVAERTITTSPQCGNDESGPTTSKSVLWRAKDLSGPASMLMIAPSDDAKAWTVRVERLEEKVDVDGRAHSCVVVKRRDAEGAETTLWLADGVPEGCVRTLRTGLKERANGRVTTEIDRRLVAYEVKK